jgi:hypothetical protein
MGRRLDRSLPTNAPLTTAESVNGRPLWLS